MALETLLRDAFGLAKLPHDASLGDVLTGDPSLAARVQEACQSLADAVWRAFPDAAPTVLGIANGGISVAQRLVALLESRYGVRPHSGVVDISFYRDDIGRRPVPPVLQPTDVPGEVEDASLLLVDDVLQTGRTVRAALEEIFAQGRPRVVRLAVLVDRGGRRLPIQPDFVGVRMELPDQAEVKVLLSNPPGPHDVIEVLPAVHSS